MDDVELAFLAIGALGAATCGALLFVVQARPARTGHGLTPRQGLRLAGAILILLLVLALALTGSHPFVTALLPLVIVLARMGGSVQKEGFSAIGRTHALDERMGEGVE